MIREICKDLSVLGIRSLPAGKDDAQLVTDLLDTLCAHADGCVGMAANMIGINKRVIVLSAENGNIAMLNPVITNKTQPYEAEEGCLSLNGVRRTKRYKNITVKFLDSSFKKRQQSFSGWTAQIIQHEIDHCDGILI